MEINHRFYDINDVRLYVAEAGREEGRPILFLHGFPEFSYAWKAQLDFFSDKGFRAVAPDQRGYNMSSKPKEVADYRIEKLIIDVVSLIRKLTSQKVTLVAHDWGGVVAWNVAERYPDLLEHLVILNMPHPDIMRRTLKRNLRQRLKSWYIRFFRLPLLPELTSRLFDCALLERTLVKTSRRGTFSAEDIRQYKSAWEQPGAIRSMINWYRAYSWGKSSKVPIRIELPTLLIWGKKDAFLSARMAQPSIDLCPNGKLVMIEKATHWVHHEKPDEVNELIWKFISPHMQGAESTDQIPAPEIG